MNRIMTLCASFLLSCIMGVSVFAQGGYEVKGVVVDAIGPIIGATVIEQGTTNGASTAQIRFSARYLREGGYLSVEYHGHLLTVHS